MILLSDLIDELVAGEGSQTASLVTKSSGEFNPLKLNSIITMVNAALADIYKRFLVNRATVVLEAIYGAGDYELSQVNEVGKGGGEFLLPGSLPGEVTAITGVRTYPSNVPLRLNQNDRPRYDLDGGNVLPAYEESLNRLGSLSTPRYNVLRVPTDVGGRAFYVDVRCAHPKIPQVPKDQQATTDTSLIQIDLPYVYKTALAYYLIHRLTNAKGAESIGRTIFHEGNNYYEKYVRECDILRQSDTEQAELITFNNNFRRTGFV